MTMDKSYIHGNVDRKKATQNMIKNVLNSEQVLLTGKPDSCQRRGRHLEADIIVLRISPNLIIMTLNFSEL